MDFCSGCIWVNLILFVIGLTVLIKGSDWFIDGASSLARRFSISDAVIGLTLVSVGTSMPEFATNIYAVCTNQPDIALGNIVGSNISNILLILGVGAMLTRVITFSHVMLWRDGMCMMGVTLLCFLFCIFGRELNRWEGGILFLSMVAYSVYLFRHRDVMEDETSDDHSECRFNSAGSAIGFSALGLLLLVAGAKMMVDNAVWFSVKLELNQAVIGSTVVALGTSLPELAVTIGGVIKKKHDIAVGNIIGSNFYNIGLILGTSALIAPIPVSDVMMYVNLPIMLVSGLMLLGFMYSGRRLVRMEGVALSIAYAIFIAWNVYKIKG